VDRRVDLEPIGHKLHRPIVGTRRGPSGRAFRYGRGVDGLTLTVPQLAAGIREALATWFADEVWVEGEIASLTRSRAGHVYFQLVEPGPPGAPPEATIDVALFANARQNVNALLRREGGVRMTDGMRIRIRGRVDLYPPQGRLQLRMTSIDPTYTLALLATERDRLLATLRAEGLITRNGSIALAPVPLRLGLVTSGGSAAMADFVDELRASGFSWHIVHADARVQGDGADRSISRALATVAAAGVDAVALVRGGGARTDLATFDSELLARTISGLDVPVLTGIGHETDTSVADLVAHTASKTPTACAATLVARVRRFLERNDVTWTAIATRAAAAARSRGVALDERAALVARTTRARLTLGEHALTAAEGRLRREPAQSLHRAALRLDTAAARIDAADPRRTLARGWSITRTASGTVVRRSADLAPGDQLVTTFADGTAHSHVTRVEARPPDAQEPLHAD